jgi:hypothetical protein
MRVLKIFANLSNALDGRGLPVHNYFIPLLLTAGFFSCSRDSVGPPPPDPKNVYIAGSGISATQGVIARVWKNGIIIDLPAFKGAETASALFVSGNDVYTAGTESDGPKSFAKYWRNTTPFVIGDSTSHATAIAVSGTDVYVAGTGLNSNQSITVAEYWKNGIQTNLSDGSLDAHANAVAVSGNNIYVAGSEKNTSTFKFVAKIWLNGQSLNLSDSANDNEASSMAVSGNDVYVAGNESVPLTSITKAKYWKNGVGVNLTDGNRRAFANSIFVSGNDVYVAGVELNAANNAFYDAKYWKNGNEVILATGTGSGNNAKSIFVLGNDVYVLGTYAGSSVYWKNGIMTYISTNPNEFVNDIFVTYK